jgi:hypothetical protein
MIKTELISRIAEQNPHLFAKDVKKAINAIFDEIEAALVRRDCVELRGFGAFTVRTWLPDVGVIRIPRKASLSLRRVTLRSNRAERCMPDLTEPGGR